MRRVSNMRFVGARFLPITLLALGCDGSTATDPTASTSAYLTTLPAWSDFSPAVPDTDSIIDVGTTAPEIAGGASYICETTPYSISRTPEIPSSRSTRS